MKKLIFFTVAIGMALFFSCENIDSDYLANSTWKAHTEYNDGGWSEDVLTFTSTQVTFTSTSSVGTNDWGFTGTYTFDPPTVRITRVSDGYMNGFVNTGTVKKKSMKIGINGSDDLVIHMELKKQ